MFQSVANVSKCNIYLFSQLITQNNQSMRLTKKALRAINNQTMRLLIALALGCSEMTVRRYIKSNDENLTKQACLQVIRRETGLSDSELLEVEKKGSRSNGHKHTVGN